MKNILRRVFIFFYKSVKYASFLLRRFYEVHFSYFIASKLLWIYWPIYIILKHMRVCFVFNISNGVGHIIVELDNFFRKLNCGEIGREKRYVLILHPSDLSKTCKNLYAKSFYFFSTNRLLYYLMLPIMIGYKDLTIDCGLSRLKRQIIEKKNINKACNIEQNYIYQISKKDGLKQLNKYFHLRKKTLGYFPLKLAKFNSSQIESLIGRIEGTKIALIHIKEKVINATANITDPNTYLSSIKYLKEKKYKVVFVGREKMPIIFEKMGVINYSQSCVSSFYNDFVLFHLAHLSIICSSGVSFFPDCLNKFYLYINSWHFSQPMFSKKCIMIPTLISTKEGRNLSILEQKEVYDNLPDIGAECFPRNKFSPRNASEDEILEGIKELIDLKENKKNKKPINKLVPKLDGACSLGAVESRWSEYFIKKHEHILFKRGKE
jgi:putative glycosyltransferase (TIGR04372 family)